MATISAGQRDGASNNAWLAGGCISRNQHNGCKDENEKHPTQECKNERDRRPVPHSSLLAFTVHRVQRSHQSARSAHARPNGKHARQPQCQGGNGTGVTCNGIELREHQGAEVPRKIQL
jgi:hypothetical protein